MPQFRKKPVLIEAFQWNPDARPTDAPEWFWEHFQFRPEINLADKSLSIATLEGTMRAMPGDWIIRGVNGELYPCKPDIFDKTYDPV